MVNFIARLINLAKVPIFTVGCNGSTLILSVTKGNGVINLITVLRVLEVPPIFHETWRQNELCAALISDGYAERFE